VYSQGRPSTATCSHPDTGELVAPNLIKCSALKILHPVTCQQPRTVAGNDTLAQHRHAMPHYLNHTTA
jgi:hypothetical protein